MFAELSLLWNESIRQASQAAKNPATEKETVECVIDFYEKTGVKPEIEIETLRFENDEDGNPQERTIRKPVTKKNCTDIGIFVGRYFFGLEYSIDALERGLAKRGYSLRFNDKGTEILSAT
ncbi:MAG TPA: hypothetical protein DCL21_06570 [Alphaproteobacteria bacterium]|nr:hypothetical protein [Alphaproteobacteria bacterium]